MIVRISGEDQYRLQDSENGRLNELDAAVLDAIQVADEAGFEGAYRALLDFVRDHGTPVADDEIESSDLILPPADISLHEASGEFTGEGLIPD
jgi:PspA-Associated protein